MGHDVGDGEVDAGFLLHARADAELPLGVRAAQAELLAFFEQDDACTVQRGLHGGRQTAHAATHHDDVRVLGRRLVRESATGCARDGRSARHGGGVGDEVPAREFHGMSPCLSGRPLCRRVAGELIVIE